MFMTVPLNERWEALCQASVDRFGHALAWAYQFLAALSVTTALWMATFAVIARAFP